MGEFAKLTAGAILGSGAGAIMAFALYDAWPGLAPRGSLTALLLAGAGAVLGILWLLRKRGRRREARRLAWSAVAAAALVLILRPFQEAPLAWKLMRSREHGQPLWCQYQKDVWGVSHQRVAAFHASSTPDDFGQPFRHRAEADVRALVVLGPARLTIHATQPKESLIDAATGRPRPGLDGVTGLVLARPPGRWSDWITLGRLELEPHATGWTDVDVEIPAGFERLAVSWDPRADMTRDYLFAAFEPPRSSPILGLPRVFWLRFGEFLLFTIAAAAVGVLIGRVVAAVSRLSSGPTLRVEPRRFRLRAIHGLAIAVVLLAPLALAIPVAPWLEAATTPVVVDWQAPEGASLEVFFGDGPDDHVPGVRLGAARFGAELPPRPAYRLSFLSRWDSPEAAPPLGDVRVLDSRDSRVAFLISGRDLQAVAPATNGPPHAESRRSAHVAPSTEIRVGVLSQSERVAAVWLGGACSLAILFGAAWLLVRNATTHDRTGPAATAPVLPLAISALLVLAVTTTWALSAPILVTEDTINYLQKGDVIAVAGSYETGSQGCELVRTPGYPAFLAVVLKLFGKSYTAVAIAQGAFHALALFFAALSLRKSVGTWWLALGIIAGGTFLSHLHFARFMISESVFVSTALVALGCFWFSRASRPPKDVAWMLGFGLATAAAVYVRVIGIALLAVPAVPWASAAVALWKADASRRSRLATIARHSVPLCLPVVLVVASVLAWSWRNELRRGFFGFAAMESLTNLQAEVQAGTLDPRALIPLGVYEQFVRERARDRGMWTVWHIYGAVFEHAETRSENDGKTQKRVIAAAERIFEETYRSSNAPIPLAGRLVKFLRHTWSNVGLETKADYTGARTQARADYWGLDATFEGARPRQVSIDQESGIPMQVAARPLLPIADLFRWQAVVYPQLHAALLAGALLGGLLMLATGRPGLAAPFVFVAANFAVLGWVRQHEVRYMVVMDVFCILQIVVALGSRAPGYSVPANSTSETLTKPHRSAS